LCCVLHGKIYSIHHRGWLDERPPIHLFCRCRIRRCEAINAGAATDREDDGADWHLKYVGWLPKYYITKEEAEEAGWIGKEGNLGTVLPDMMIGGDIFYNDNGQLPDEFDRIWYEADINYSGGYRNSARIVYSNDGLIFVTYDHYRTFIEII
jgi:hypothetical protein